MAEVVVRPLARSDDRSDFGCGDIDLDRFFQRYAGQNQFRHHIGNTYVAVDAKVAAIPFYTTLGFRPLEAMQGALGDRPEPLPMFLAIRRIVAALE